MSNDKPVTVHSVPETQEETPVVKQSIFRKTGSWVKNHKKTTIAVVGLGALITLASVTGSKTANTNEVSTDVTDDEVLAELDFDPTVPSES